MGDEKSKKKSLAVFYGVILAGLIGMICWSSLDAIAQRSLEFRQIILLCAAVAVAILLFRSFGKYQAAKKGKWNFPNGENTEWYFLLSRNIYVNNWEDGIQVDIPTTLRRRPSGTIVIILFFILWVAITVFSWMKGAPLIFPLIFAMIGALIAWMILQRLLGASRIFADKTGISWHNPLLPFLGGKEFASSEVMGIGTHSWASDQDVEGKRKLARVWLRLKDGKSRTISWQVEEEEAKALKKVLLLALGFSEV